MGTLETDVALLITFVLLYIEFLSVYVVILLTRWSISKCYICLEMLEKTLFTSVTPLARNKRNTKKCISKPERSVCVISVLDMSYTQSGQAILRTVNYEVMEINTIRC